MSAQRADEILGFIKGYVQKENMAPSVREICDGVGIRSTSTVHRYLHRLETEGRIHMASGKNRAIVITDGAETESPGIPLIRTFSDKLPLLTPEHIETYLKIELPGQHDYDNPLFALRVQGGGAAEAGLRDGDLVVAEQRLAVMNGEVAVLLNEQNEPMFRTAAEGMSGIIGRVVMLVRYL